MRRLFLLALPLAVLTGCGSFGTQYQSASESEPHAKFEKFPPRSTMFYTARIVNFDQQGCMSGVTDGVGLDGVRLRTGEEVVIGVQAVSFVASCGIVLGMIPQAGATYGARFNWSGSAYSRCTVRLVRVEADGREVPAPVRRRKGREGFGCYRAEPMPR